MTDESASQLPRQFACLSMLVGRFFIVVGSNDPDWTDVEETPEDAGATWSNRHVLVAVEAAEAAVTVRLWVGPDQYVPAGHRRVFDGALRLDDGSMRIAEPIGLRYLVCKVAPPGDIRTVISVEGSELPTEVDVWVHQPS